jgi:membrane protein implicated in regulation of membrane protease activity
MSNIEEYGVFGIISTIAGFWYAATLLLIRENQVKGWFFAIISVVIVWGMMKYIEWLYKPSTRQKVVIILLISEIPPTIFSYSCLLYRDTQVDADAHN